MKEQSISIKKTFDNFIVSRSNVEAYSACVDLVNDPKGRLVVIYCMPLKMNLSRETLICPFVLLITMV